MKKFLSIFLLMIPLIAISQAINSPNMNLPIPIPGVTSGPQWAQDINASLTLIDQHNHTSGQGVQIPPAGININSSLSFQNNPATNLQACVFTPQASYTTNYGLHSEGVDLYFVDGNGNDIRLTSGGSVNATSSGIQSGTATASFSAGVLVVDSNSNTPANIQGGSILLGNNVANSKYLTLSPPSSMAANYSLTLPSIPAQTNVMTLDTSGNIGSTTWNTVANNRTRATGTTVGQGGIAISASSGPFSTNSGTPVAVTNLSVTITTGGNPIVVRLIGDGTSHISSLEGTASGSTSISATFQIYNGSTVVGNYLLSSQATGNSNLDVPSSVLSTVDIETAGTYTYTVKVTSNTGATESVIYAKLMAYEL